MHWRGPHADNVFTLAPKVILKVVRAMDTEMPNVNVGVQGVSKLMRIEFAF